MTSDRFIILTIDVEDWFQVENLRNRIPYSTWSGYELRVEKNTHKLLDIFDSARSVGKPQARGKNTKNKLSKNISPHEICSNESEVDFVAANSEQLATATGYAKNVKATFFVLGWIAKKVPHLVREICDRGHEVASHGFYHKLSSIQAPKELRSDLSDSKKLLQDIAGTGVHGYRTPNFAINNDILNIVEEAGYQYDSSFNSFSMHGRYGHLNMTQKKKYGIATKISNSFWELPISNLSFNNPISNLRSAISSKRNNQKSFVLPWGGGAYFRLLPSKLFRLGVQSILEKRNAYVFYLHPWELDPQQPRVKDMPIFNKFRHYCNLQKTAKNLISFIHFFRGLNFLTCSQYLKMIKNDGFIES